MNRFSSALIFVFPALVFGAETPARAAEAASATIASTSSGYELCGFFGAGENIEASVRRVGTEKSEWLRVGQKSGDLLIEKADPKAGTAVLLVGGRRMTLKLAFSSNATTFVAPEIAKESSPEETKSAKEEARKKRHARFHAMQVNTTPEQMQAFGKVMQERMEVVRKEKPDLFMADAWEDEGKYRESHELMIPVMKEAAEAASKLPGKDGKITPVDPDFESMIRAEMEYNLEQMREDRAASEAAE